MTAAILLCAAALLRELDLDTAIAVDDVLEATGVTRSRAYELKAALLEIAPSILRPRGRPPALAEPAPPASETLSVAAAALAFVYAHPGCVSGGPKRRRYMDPFRRFVITLREEHSTIDLAVFARAISVPVETLEDWLRASPAGGSPTSAAEASTTEEEAAAPTADEAKRRSIELVLAAWKTWHGNFSDFCEHVREQWRVLLGNTLIGSILEAHGLRTPNRRPRRTPDEIASRDSFETFFPGAQWTGDGTVLPVVVDGQRFDVNVEIDVDTHTAAIVGCDVTDEENEQAVIDTFASGVETTGATPLALLLDNKPSNHTEAVDAALEHDPDRSLDCEDTLRLRATPYRPQNKAHCEGAFGLFKTTAPPIVITTKSPPELARQIAELQVTTWARTLNHRPRGDRDGRSRFDLYYQPITEQQIAEARAALNERCRKQELARRTRLARLEPLVRAMLDDAFVRLDLRDPEDHIKSAIAVYGPDAIVAGIAIFTAKRDARTLPPTADARYLLGIVRNVAAKNELVALATTIVDERIRWRDHATAALAAEIDALRTNTAPEQFETALAVRVLAAERIIDEIVLGDALAKDIIARPPDQRRAAFERVARIVSSSFSVPNDRRQRVLVTLAAAIWPLS